MSYFVFLTTLQARFAEQAAYSFIVLLATATYFGVRVSGTTWLHLLVIGLGSIWRRDPQTVA